MISLILQAASVLAQVRREGLEKTGKKWPQEEVYLKVNDHLVVIEISLFTLCVLQEAKFKATIEEKYEQEGDPYYSSARLWYVVCKHLQQ